MCNVYLYFKRFVYFSPQEYAITINDCTGSPDGELQNNISCYSC